MVECDSCDSWIQESVTISFSWDDTEATLCRQCFREVTGDIDNFPTFNELHRQQTAI